MSDEGRARRRKRTASDDVVMAFLEAVYPGSGNLVAVCFDEEMVLREATRQILAAAAARAEGEAAGLERLTAERDRLKALLTETVRHIQGNKGAWEAMQYMSVDARQAKAAAIAECDSLLQRIQLALRGAGREGGR